MQIPIVQPVDVSSQIPAHRASPEQLAHPYEVIARGVHSFVTASEDVARIEAAKREEQDKDTALDLFTRVAPQVEAAREQARLPQSGDNPHGTPEGEPISKTYVERVGGAVDRIYKGALASTDDPRVQHYLSRTMLRLKGDALVQAHRDAFAMYRDEQAADIPQRLETLRVQAIASPATRETIVDQARTYLDAKGGILPASKIADLKERFGHQVAFGIAKREIDADPFTADVTRYAGELSPELHLTLQEYQTTAQNRESARQRRAQTELETARKRRAEQGESQLFDLVTGGQVTSLQQAEQHPAWGDFNFGQKEALGRLIENPRQPASDPATRAKLMLAVTSDRPSVSEAQIDALTKTPGANGLPLLNIGDAINAKEQLRASVRYWRAESEKATNRAEDKTLADLHRRQTETAQIFDRATTITGPGAQWADVTQNQIQAEYRDAMNRRSKSAGSARPGFPRTEEPEAVHDDVMLPLMLKQDSIMRDRYQQLQSAMALAPFKSPQDVERAFANGRIGDAERNRRLDEFGDLARATKAAQDMAEKLKRAQAARKGRRGTGE
jgi:hypothetical protein